MFGNVMTRSSKTSEGCSGAARRSLPLVLAAVAVAGMTSAPVSADPPDGPLTAASTARGTYQITGDATDLTVTAVGVDAQELLTAIAAKANLPLVMDDTVSRKITINILHRPAKALISSIVSAYGLSSAEVNGVTMISEGIPRSPSSYLLSDIDSIRTKYVDANNARGLLPAFLQDYVKVNAEQNSVVLSAPTDILAKFRDDIGQFDTPASQILVDLTLVELTNTTAEQAGLSTLWQNAGRGASIDPANGLLNIEAITNLPNNFAATLTALESKGLARVRANPRIATISGRHANIFVGQQRYLVTPIDAGDGSQSNFISAGVRLGITPYTGGQGQVLVDLDTEVSTLTALDPITQLPDKDTRTANTTVRVNDGQTIVIGGFVQQEIRGTRTKMPILGDIPLIGPALFRTKNVSTTQSELILFITPRVLSGTGHLPADEEKAMLDKFEQGSPEPKMTAPITSEPKMAVPAAPTIPPDGVVDPNKSVPVPAPLAGPQQTPLDAPVGPQQKTDADPSH